MLPTCVLQESLLEAHMNDVGQVDFGQSRRGASLPKQVKAFVALLHAAAEAKSSALFQVRKRTKVLILLFRYKS